MWGGRTGGREREEGRRRTLKTIAHYPLPSHTLHSSAPPRRIHILEKRLKRHEEQALHKYYELDHKLRSDARLAALLMA